MEYDNTNKGALFKNKKRETNKHPEYTGTLNVDGKEFWLSAWVKEAKTSGEKYFSMSIKAKEPKGEESQAEKYESDVPF